MRTYDIKDLMPAPTDDKSIMADDWLDSLKCSCAECSGTDWLVIEDCIFKTQHETKAGCGNYVDFVLIHEGEDAHIDIAHSVLEEYCTKPNNEKVDDNYIYQTFEVKGKNCRTQFWYPPERWKNF